MKSEAARLVDAAVRAELVPLLRADGFKGSGRTFRRTRGELVQLLSITGSRYGGELAVDLAVHLTFLPNPLGDLVDPRTLTVPSCEFRRRMTRGEPDLWWRYGPDELSVREAVRGAASVYASHGRAQLAVLDSFPESFAHVTPEAVASRSADLGGFAPTVVRTALVFARIRLHERNLEAARSFAAVGLANLGRATGLKRAFEEIEGVSSRS